MPELTIRRRFHAGLRNFHNHYRVQVNAWVLYDNSSLTPILLEWGENP